MTDALNALPENRSYLNLSGFDSVLCSDNLSFIINFLNINISEYKDTNQTSSFNEKVTWFSGLCFQQLLV